MLSTVSSLPKKLTPSSSPARSPLASAPRSLAVSVREDDDLRFPGDNGGYKTGMELDHELEGGLTPPPQPCTPAPSEIVLPPMPPPLPLPKVCSPLLNTDVDTNYVENGDDGSKRLRVDSSVGQSVPDASTLSKALRWGHYSSDDTRMLQKSLAKFVEEQHEEHTDAEACSVLFGEREDRDEALLLASKILGGPST